MKHCFGKSLWGVLAFALMLSACGGKKSKATDEPTRQDTTIGSRTVVEFSVDSTTLVWIQDNAGDKLMPRTLFADAPDSLVSSLGLENGIPSSVSTFLMEKKDSCVMLFDTGNGAPDSRLMDGLAQMGLSPADVRYLYLTHFHGDHVGGMMRGDMVVFPNAEVYASKVEYDAWMQMPDEQKALVVKTMEAYKNRLHLFQFGDTLPGGVVALEAVGHTPGHTVFQAGKILVVGDLMHGVALQKEHPEFCASYDRDKEAAVATRKRILKYVRDNGLTMAGMHFPAPGIIAGE